MVADCVRFCGDVVGNSSDDGNGDMAGKLALTRRPGESVVITDQATGQRIRVGLVMIERGKVKLTFEADRGYRILRSEIQEQVDGEVKRED